MQNHHQYHLSIFEDTLKDLYGSINEALLKEIESEIDWIDLKGGEMLFSQGDISDALYVMISGRLSAYTKVAGKSEKLGDIMRGETVGELAMFTGEARTADIIAARDSIVVRLSKEGFYKSLAKSPEFSINTTRLIINRFTKKPKKSSHAPINICLLPVHESINTAHWVELMLPTLYAFGNVRVLTSAQTDAHFSQPGISQVNDERSKDYNQVTLWLNEEEATNNYVVYVADYGDTGWTNRCKRQADHIVILADAQENPEVRPMEPKESAASHVKNSLVLIHPEQTAMPKNTAAWLAARPFLNAHYHLRIGNKADIGRIARTISGNATGLVLAGGGAKGFAHVGIYLALKEHNIPVDFVGGTSIGATAAAAIATDRPEVLRKYMKKAALYNPTKDLNVWPIISLMKGKRLNDMMENAIHDFCGRVDVHMEDSWLPCFAVSSNYTRARQEIHKTGSLKNNLLASIAIPGIFPPVVQGNDLLIDGGTFNNFPVDVMVAQGVKYIIGCDLVTEKNIVLKFTQTPTSWQILKDRLKPKHKRIYRMPNLTSMMLNTTILYSHSKREEAKAMIDLLFNPNLSRYGMTNWKAYDKIVDIGYNHAKEVLANLDAEKLKALQAT